MTQHQGSHLVNTVRTISYQIDDYLTETEKQAVYSAEKKAETIVSNAVSRVDEIVRHAEEESLRILQAAQLKAEEIQAKAQEEGQKLGYDAGYNVGYKQAMDDAKGTVNAADVVLKGAYKAQKEIIRATEREILSLSSVISKSVIREELNMNSNIILNLVRTAAQELKERESIRIFINPVNVQLLVEGEAKLKESIIALEHIKIVEDKSVGRDGVVVESPSGRIDASVETQINEILQKMLESAANDPVKIDIPENRPISEEDIQTILHQSQNDNEDDQDNPVE